ncbi:MAG: hypothetical protein GC172_12290 [Phycisphaera sp.]|nr:hypothetical protein [Phycisphaera sp.]
MTNERNTGGGSGAADDDGKGPYRILEEEEAARPSRGRLPGAGATGGRVGEKALSGAREDEGEAEGEVEDDVEDVGDDDGDSLPPPISRPTAPTPWVVVAGVAFALLVISWLAGAPQLSLPDPDGGFPELGIGERLAGLAQTAVFLPLATMAALLGVGTLAFVRQRPLGDTAALAAKCAAIVALAALVWLVPVEIRFVKQTLHVVGLPLIAGLLAVPVLRLHPRDAALATGAALVAMSLLVLGAHVVVWATGAV